MRRPLSLIAQPILGGNELFSLPNPARDVLFHEVWTTLFERLLPAQLFDMNCPFSDFR